MNDRVTIRVNAEMIAALDRLIATDVIRARSRQDAFRHIVEEWLTNNGHMGQRAHGPIGQMATPVSNEGG